MNAVYIGILTPGTTSRMRAEWLQKLTPGWKWTWVDTDVPMLQSLRVWRTLAFRCQLGAVVRGINRAVLESLQDQTFDLVWIDKGVFLWVETVRQIRKRAKKLIHFTPDTAFHANQSRHFEGGMTFYDLLVTTKSFELDEYDARVGKDRTLLSTQAYDSALHFPRRKPTERRKEVVFIGLAEPDREHCLATLLAKGIPVRLGGMGWKRFLKKRGRNPCLTFIGEQIFGPDYAEAISGSWFGLGLLSKRFPELHTTRTFEIPACGTVLATERNAETSAYFKETEAVFCEDDSELAERLGALLGSTDMRSLEKLAEAGRARVCKDGRDYGSVLSSILSDRRISQ